MNEHEEKLLERIEVLERELEMYRRVFIVTPTKVTIKQSVLINGMMNADRVYTKRSGNHVELTT
jgi:hypothetical protein